MVAICNQCIWSDLCKGDDRQGNCPHFYPGDEDEELGLDEEEYRKEDVLRADAEREIESEFEEVEFNVEIGSYPFH